MRNQQITPVPACLSIDSSSLRARHRRRINQMGKLLIPPLTLADILGFEVLWLRFEIIRRELRPTSGFQNWTDAQDDYAKARAARLVCLNAAELCVKAGATPFLLSASSATHHLVRWSDQWSEHCLAPILELALAGQLADEREEAIYLIWWQLIHLIMDPEQLKRGIRRGLLSSGAWKDLRHGTARDSDSEAHVLAAAYYGACPNPANLYSSSDGLLRVSWRQIRDAHGRPRQKMMVGPAEPGRSATPGEEKSLGARSNRRVKVHPVSDIKRQDAGDYDTLLALDVMHALEVADAAVEGSASDEARAAVQAVASEFIQEKATPLEVLLLDRAWDLISETTTPTELAREACLTERTARAAWARLVKRMGAHPRLRAFLRSA